jgi:hypothetical protein
MIRSIAILAVVSGALVSGVSTCFPPTPTPTSATPTVSGTPTEWDTLTPTEEVSATATLSSTPTPSLTATPSVTAPSTPTATETAILTPTAPSTATVASTQTATATATGTAAVSPTAAPGAVVWLRSFGGTGADLGQVVVIAPNDARIVAGSFRATVDFGTGPVTSAGEDAFVAAYGTATSHWLWHAGNAGFNQTNGLAVDGSGNVFAVGGFTGTVDFGAGPVSSAGMRDMFLVKLSPAGQLIWAKRLGSANEDVGRAVAVDSDGNVLLTGSFVGRVDFGGGYLNGYGGDAVLARYGGADGHFIWAKNLSTGYGKASGNGVAVDGAGNVVLVGAFEQQVDFGAGALYAAGATDAFAAKYNGDGGGYLWAHTYGGLSYDAANAVATAPDGSVAVAGSFNPPVDFGGGSVGTHPNDAFVLELGADGAYRWVRFFGAAGIDTSNGVAVDGNGNVYATGDFRSSFEFGSETISGPGGQDIFVASWDANGAERWARAFGGASDDIGRGVAIGPGAEVSLTGTFSGEASFGGMDATSAGLTDVFLVGIVR